MSSALRKPPTLRLDGDRIRELREAKGLTQLYVAEVAAVSVDTVSRWENNRTPAVKRDNAEALARALEVDLTEIVRLDEAGPGELPAAPRRWRGPALAGALLLALALGWGAWRALAPAPLEVAASRRLPPYTPPGTAVPVVVQIRAAGGQEQRVILREHLPPGWTLLAANSPPDQGPGESGVLKWIVNLQGGAAAVAYLVRAPGEAREGTIHRFSGEVVGRGRGERAVPVRGQARIDLEFVHWADEDADFQISDSEVLDALERLEAAQGLGLSPSDLRHLWGAPEYEWNRGEQRFQPH